MNWKVTLSGAFYEGSRATAHLDTDYEVQADNERAARQNAMLLVAADYSGYSTTTKQGWSWSVSRVECLTDEGGYVRLVEGRE